MMAEATKRRRHEATKSGHGESTPAHCPPSLGRFVASSLSPRRAFTLVELMISVVLVLLLILGINQVFRITADAVGAGQSMSSIVRDNRAAHVSFYSDLK